MFQGILGVATPSLCFISMKTLDVGFASSERQEDKEKKRGMDHNHHPSKETPTVLTMKQASLVQRRPFLNLL